VALDVLVKAGDGSAVIVFEMFFLFKNILK
jgi:hypothetical protein